MDVYKKHDGVYQLKFIDDLYETVDDCLAQINMILGNRFVGFMRKTCEKMKKENDKQISHENNPKGHELKM